jgi:hypothetical protein
MYDEPAFTGHSSGIQSDRFDLGDWSGVQIRIRIDLATEEAPDIDDFWRIYGISYERATADLSFAVQRELTLYPVYPNPTSGITRIGYTVENAGDVGIEVYDMLGRRVRLVTEAYLEPGTYEKSLDTTGLAAGVYVVRMAAEGRQLVRTLSVVR